MDEISTYNETPQSLNEQFPEEGSKFLNQINRLQKNNAAVRLMHGKRI